MYLNIVSWYSVILSLLLVVIEECVAARVCTPKAGCYNGTFMFSYPSADPFDAFLGIPYANKPKRFEPAVIYRSAKEHNAKVKGKDCLQKDYLVPDHDISGGEDCLYLNVYRKETKSNRLLPVMVYIFGEGFFAGTSSPSFVGPEYIMDSEISLDIILVTFNYRLGAFGFMGTSDGVIPGNLGLKDQVVALQWVSENIAFFGGNKFKVTLVGHGAGAIAAHLHVLSPISNNFHAVIAMSGTATSPYAVHLLADHITRLTAMKLNITYWASIKTTQLLEELRKTDQLALLNAADKLKYWDVDNLVIYRPMIEKPSPTAFLSEHPIDILRSGSYRHVPIMFGSVPNEGGIRAVAIMESAKLKHFFNKQFNYLLTRMIEFPIKFNDSKLEKKMEEVLDEYFVGETILNDITREGFVDLITDRFYYYPLYTAMKIYVRHVNYTKYPVYMYNFNFLGRYTYSYIYSGHEPKTEYGVIHGDDLIYLFRSPSLFPDFDKHSVDATTIREFVSDFVYFVYNHKPTKAASIKPCNSQTFNQRPNEICDYKEYVKNSNGDFSVRIVNTFDTRRMFFWDRILENHYLDDDYEYEYDYD